MALAAYTERRHIENMADVSPPVVQIKENADGSWSVAVSWRDGRSEQLSNFQTEPEARKWGQSHILKWLDSRKNPAFIAGAGAF